MSWKMTVFNQFGAISVKLFTCNSNQPTQFIWAPSPQWPFSRLIRRNGGRPLGAQLNGHQPESREQFMQGFDHFSSSHTGRRVPSLPPTLDLCYLRMYICMYHCSSATRWAMFGKDYTSSCPGKDRIPESISIILVYSLQISVDGSSHPPVLGSAPLLSVIVFLHINTLHGTFLVKPIRND